MSLSVSPKMKIVALVGVLAALVLGAASMMLGRSQPDPNAASTVPLRHFKPRVTKSPATPAKPVAAKPKPKRKPAAQPITAPNGLPTALDELLHGHRVVIVALWDPEVPSDRYSFLEAQAGARDANAGFLGVSVLDERLAAPLTALAGNGTLLQSPGILIYKQPSTLMNRIDGFSDRAAVAEAVASALLAEAPLQGVTPAPAPVPAAPVPSAVPAAPTS